MNSSILKAAISSLHPPPDWKVLTEYRVGSRIADVLAVNPARSFLIGYEVKVTRSDFHADARNPAKREPVWIASDEFYYVAAAGMIPVAQVPSGCGLLEFTGQSFTLSVRAPLRRSVRREHLDPTLRAILMHPKDIQRNTEDHFIRKYLISQAVTHARACLPRILSFEQAVFYSGLNPNVLHELIADGVLKPFEGCDGKFRRVDFDHLDKLMSEHCKPAPPDDSWFDEDTEADKKAEQLADQCCAEVLLDVYGAPDPVGSTQTR